MKLEKIIISLIVGLSFLGATMFLAYAYRYKIDSRNTITVTGLGEREFISDIIVWRGSISAQSIDRISGYNELEKNKGKVLEYLRKNGIADSSIVFMFVNSYPLTEALYSSGQYVGQRQTGYQLSQDFTIESRDVEKVEELSRQISSLIAQGVTIDSYQPEYYFSGLSDVKLELISQATEDARDRAKKIAHESKSKLGDLANARMGVFQITGANSNSEFSAGGSFDTATKRKKARITMRLEYKCN